MKVRTLSQQNSIEFFNVDDSNPLHLQFVGDISHGFPLPSEDYMDKFISLDEELVKHKDATIYGRVKGDSMKDANLEEGDVLIIDRAVKVESGEIGIFRIDGDFICKRLYIFTDRVELHPANKRFKVHTYDNDNLPSDFLCIGRVMYTIKKTR
ncbi:LexA family protein [Flavobacterium hauense]